MGAQGLSRRNFIAGAVMAGSSLALASVAGCSPEKEGASESKSSSSEELKASETKQTDIVVVGSGPAGLSAAIEAAELGVSVVLLESQSTAGGNLDGTEGLMGVNSDMAKAQGAEVDPSDIVNDELSNFSYRVDALKWMELVEASGDNIQWLIDHGVKFQPEVIDYTNNGGPIIYHAWDLDHKPSDALVPAAESAGVEILINTKGKQLITTNDSISGIYAERKDGSILQIDCKAVILAGGGYTNNVDMISKVIRQEHYYTRSLEGHDGSCIQMAIDAGAKSMLAEQTLMAYPASLVDTNKAWYYTFGLMMSGKIVWVNQDGLRFTNEGCTAVTPGLAVVTCLTQQKSYTLTDSSVLSTFTDDGFSDGEKRAILEMGKDAGVTNMAEGQKFLLDSGIEAGEKTIWKGNTWEEVAEASGVDKETLLATVKKYNDDCESGVDGDFRKPADMLMKLATPPFYMFENGYYITTTLGGLDYDRQMRVLDEKGNPIPGLYVAGVDGAQIYKSFYTLNTSGSCNANNVYTGRTAAQTAVESIGK